MEAMENLKIKLLNVEEAPYQVIYYFETESGNAAVRFHYNKSNRLTSCSAQSTLGTGDEQLRNLLESLKNF